MKMVKTSLSLGYILAIMSILQVAMAANYTVGGSSGGWDQMTDLATWASSQTFQQGDILLFIYSPNHDVTEVSAADFGPCTDTNPLQPRQTGGSTTITLTSAGSRYFICTSHCQAGMKVQIDTLAASAPPPATPSPPPTPSATPPPRSATPSPPPPKRSLPPTLPPSASTGPPPSASLSPPPPPSSAAKFGGKGAITGFAMVMMLFNL